MYTLIILAATGLICLLSEIFNLRKIVLPAVVLGLLGAGVANAFDWNSNASLFKQMMLLDNYAVAFTGLLIVITLLWFLMSSGFTTGHTHDIDHIALIVFALLGATVMVTYSNMIMLFIGIEILSISLYVLAGSNKLDLAGNEAAFKYFLMGSFATGFLLFGITLIYGATGTFNLQEIAQQISSPGFASGPIFYAGILLLMVALCFIVAEVPFHFWAPDVYQGSPNVVTAFMSTVVKTAAFAAFLRLFLISFSQVPELYANTIYFISAASIIIGNITAVYQTSFKRMLAYSSIAHAGYMLMSIMSMNEYSSPALLFYTAAYSISSLASFVILILISRYHGSEDLNAFRGLGKKNPLLAAVTVVAMLSLAGIPPLAGFFGKYYIFSAALKSGFTSLVVISVVGSLIGVYYYFKPIIHLFRAEENAASENPSSMSFAMQLALVLTAATSLTLGIMPNLLAGLLQ